MTTVTSLRLWLGWPGRGCASPPSSSRRTRRWASRDGGSGSPSTSRSTNRVPRGVRRRIRSGEPPTRTEPPSIRLTPGSSTTRQSAGNTGLAGRHTGVNREHCARDGIAVGSANPRNQGGHLFGLDEAAELMMGGELGRGLKPVHGGRGLEHGGRRRARANRVGGNALWPKFCSQALDEADYSVLRRGVTRKQR